MIREISSSWRYTMKIAIPVFQNRVSPRFEFAPKLLLATVHDAKVVEKQELDLSAFDYDLFQRSALLHNLGVEVFICGGLQDFVMRLLNAHKVRVVTSVSGDAEAALQWFLRGTLSSPAGQCQSGGRGRRSLGGSRVFCGNRRNRREV
jgi:predicted Fe-Mo cluster-binding NifX family protein